MKRDVRDPQKVGETLLLLRERSPKKAKLHEIADDLAKFPIEAYDADPSCLDKYGAPADLEPRFEEIQVR